MQGNIESLWTFENWSPWEKKATNVWAKTKIQHSTIIHLFKVLELCIMEELHILLTPNKEHKKVFPNVLVIGFRNGKSLKDFLVRARLPKLNESRRYEPCGKITCLVCDSISTLTTFKTEACQETFKVQSGPLTCDSEKVLCLLKCKIGDEVSYVGKAKTKFHYRFNNYRSKHRAFRKGNRKFLRNYVTITIVLMAIAAFRGWFRKIIWAAVAKQIYF